MEFDNSGYELLQNFVAREQIDALLPALHEHQLEPLRGGIRHIDRIVPAVAALAHSARLKAAAQRRLGDMPHLVRAIYFEKSPENNWLVSWHQDRTVCVTQRFDAPDWGPWSRKAGVWHVQPPLAVLQNMITLRLHLDAATTENGCLKLIPGSHRGGLLSAEQVAAYVETHAATYVEASAGDALLMRPHLLHASEKAARPAARRILHFEYVSHDLPPGIGWNG